MKALFCAQHFGYYRNFESAIRELARRGHAVHLSADEPDSLGGRALVERLAAECPGVSWSFAPALDDEPWINTARKGRHALEYVRFLDPRGDASKYRARAATRAPRLVRALARWRAFRSRPARATLARLLVAVERRMPTSAALERYVAALAPDVVLLASMTNPGSPQLDHMKCARRLGLPTVMCVFSWDHLSGKSWIRMPPDRVLVWNETQKAEAVEQHGVPAERVEVTGAQCYDHWFGAQPARGREAFCRAVGLDPARPFVLYACSVLSRPAPVEADFALEWIRAIRASADPDLSRVGILVRPHPERMGEWDGRDLSAFPNLALCGRNPIDAEAKAEYFESMYHSAAVVGLVTTVSIEAAVTGREVLTLELPAFALHQAGTAHFHYLKTVGGGVLHAADDIAGHLTQLAAVLRAGGDRSERNRRFLEAFVRPYGLDVPATPRFADAVERAARLRPERAAVPGRLVGRLAGAGRDGVLAWCLMDAREAEAAVLEHGKAVRKAVQADGRLQQRHAKQDEREARLRAKADARRRKTSARATRVRRRRFGDLTRRVLARLHVRTG